jgi:hypothetical protein
MALPKSVQRQLDQANQAEAAIALEMQNAPQVLTDPSQLAAPANDPVSAPPQPAEPVQAPATADDPNSPTWQQRFKSLQGMFAQKTGELQAQSKVYESQMASLQTQLAALQQAKMQEPSPKKDADPKDIENFGSDMIEMVQRYAERMFQSVATQLDTKVAAMDSRIGALEQQVTGVSNRTEITLEQQFYASLGGLVPDWEKINKDQRWLEWLAEVDPVYGAQRQAALDLARTNLDAQRVANVFNAFKAAHPVKVQDSLANQVAPNGAATVAPTAAAQRPILSAKLIEKFYSEVAKGRYVGREAEAARTEAEINQAAAEGRIR